MPDNHSTDTVRVRIAPSPTGFLHIGTARTALFNWLFAKKMGGKFIFRIEDTDLERSEKRFEDDIIEGLRWLGLQWDEGPYRQSERLDIYERSLRELLDKGLAYYCECTKEKLDQDRQAQQQEGKAPIYPGTCRDKNVPAERGQVIRFRVPEHETISFDDMIRGTISFETGLIGDLAIAKNLRTPLYNFAVVVDDHEMRMSHVIRGEDHIANTPKQILIARALGFTPPVYAHLPLILGTDRSKMSKRHAATSLNEYRMQGYLPAALVNFIALLGWHPLDDKEKMPAAEIIEKFDINRVQKGGAVFDVQKLNWLNAEYIKEKTGADLFAMLIALYGEEKVVFHDAPTTVRLLEIGKMRMERLSDYEALRDSFLPHTYDGALLVGKKSTREAAAVHLSKCQEIIRGVLVHEFTQENLEAMLMPYANNEGRAAVLWPLRVALTGQERSPGPFEVMGIVGKDESLRRIAEGIEKLNGPSSAA
ncbi:glutamate--tRNA ligase [Patescibacteria group bacterium]|nr:glutamate--tRNA ligase [Patescibacteria group bacterium]